MSRTAARIGLMIPAIIFCAMIVPVQVVALAVLCLVMAEYIHQKHLHHITHLKGNDEA